jgi:competence protein ComEA
MSRVLCALLVAGCLCASSTAASAQSKSPSGKASAAPASIVNLNTATVSQLATLPGIGETAAQRIVEYRDKNGGFKKVEELMNVKGIGEKSFLKLKPLVTLGDAKPAPKQ